MSCNASQENLEEISSTESCALDKMPLTTKEKETDTKEESSGESTPTKTSNLDVIHSNMRNILRNSQQDSAERCMLRNLGVSLLEGYNIEEDVKKAAESGNIEEYCKDFAKKLEECVKAEGAELVERCKHVAEESLEFLREERKKKKQGKEGAKSSKAKHKSLSKGMKAFSDETRSFADTEQLCDAVKNAMNEDLQAFQTNTTEEAQRIAEKVSDAAKKMCSTEHQESDTTLSTCSTKDESVTSLEKDGGKDWVESESDENSEKAPTTEQEEEYVVPTPPPPPPVKSPYLDIKGERNERQMNLVKKELNFALSRLTSEVISSYEQATALQKQVPPSLDKPTLDFMQNQETKKTFFIREIITRVHNVLSMLTPEPEIHDPNVDLQDLNETVRLLYLLQTSKRYHVDGVSVIRTTEDKLGVLFHTLLIITLFVIALALSLNGEWVALIVFAIVVLFFLVKAWEAVVSVRKKKVEVFGRVKKSEKLD